MCRLTILSETFEKWIPGFFAILVDLFGVDSP